jgi:hypothetical protein
MTRVAHTSGPTVAEVDAIAAMANPVLRNLEMLAARAVAVVVAAVFDAKPPVAIPVSWMSQGV